MSQIFTQLSLPPEARTDPSWLNASEKSDQCGHLTYKRRHQKRDPTTLWRYPLLLKQDICHLAKKPAYELNPCVQSLYAHSCRSWHPTDGRYDRKIRLRCSLNSDENQRNQHHNNDQQIFSVADDGQQTTAWLSSANSVITSRSKVMAIWSIFHCPHWKHVPLVYTRFHGSLLIYNNFNCLYYTVAACRNHHIRLMSWRYGWS